MLRRSREEVGAKFDKLLFLAEAACKEYSDSKDGSISGETLYRLRVSALNLLSRLAGSGSFYVEELKQMRPNAYAIKGLLQAAKDDYEQGFIADHDLAVSAEIFADMLTQCEILLEHDYKDPAAVIIGAVLEDSLRRLCLANSIEVHDRDTLRPLNDKLAKEAVYSKIYRTEIEAKATLRNDAAHGHFDKYTKADVTAALEFTRRFIEQFFVS